MTETITVTLTPAQVEELRVLVAGAAHVLEKRPLLTPTITGGTVRAPQTRAYVRRLEALAKLLDHSAQTAAR